VFDYFLLAASLLVLSPPPDLLNTAAALGMVAVGHHHQVNAISLFGIGCDLKCNDNIVDYLNNSVPPVGLVTGTYKFSGSSSFFFIFPTWFVMKCSDTNPVTRNCEAKCTPFPFLEGIGGLTCMDDGNELIFDKLEAIGQNPLTRRRRDRTLQVDVDNSSTRKNQEHTVEQQQQEACSAVNYDMYLVMEGAHMVGLATPVAEENNANHCPNMVFHSTVSPFDKKLVKVAMTVEVDAVTETAEDVKLHLGRRPLARIIDAFESADVSKGGDKAYDAITNNCVVLLRNMADPLDIPVDNRIISFITQRLLSEKSGPMIELMKKSRTLSTLWEYGGRFLTEVNAEEMVAKVIELYV
jgi:hypothetical protein